MTIQLRLVDSDLPSQVGLGLGEPVRTVRNAPDHRLAGLGPSATLQGRFLAFPVDALTSPHLFGNLLRGAANPLHPIAAVP
jgi:hypothetical protein